MSSLQSSPHAMPTPKGSTPTRAFVYWLGRRALRWVFREVHFVGREQVPKTGAVLIFGNHPNDVPDVISGLFTTTRPLRYVATISATTLPLASATYEGMGVIPVTRVRDARKMRAKGIDIAEVNRAAFASLHEAFERGDAIGMFPEGGVHDSPKIGIPRTGVAKMALESADNAAKFDLTLIPFGLQYENPRETRSDVVVVVGRPFSLREWVAEHPDPSPVALAERLRVELVGVTRNADTWEQGQQRDRLAAAVAAQMPAGTPLLVHAAAVQARAGVLADESVEIRAASDRLSEAVIAAGGRPESVRDTARVLAASGADLPAEHAAWPSLAAIVVATIPAAVGFAVHAPLWALVWRMSRALSEDRTDPIAKAIIPGLHLILFGYLVLGGVFALGFRAAGIASWWAVPLMMLLPRLGDLALWWRDAVRTLRLRGRVRGWSPSQRAAVCDEARALHSTFFHSSAV